MLDPSFTYLVLLAAQAGHLLHHRLAKRHISYAEVTTAALLLIPPDAEWIPGMLLSVAHLTMVAIQVVGSLFIRRLSPDWNRSLFVDPRNRVEGR